MGVENCAWAGHSPITLKNLLLRTPSILFQEVALRYKSSGKMGCGSRRGCVTCFTITGTNELVKYLRVTN